ncbi:MAG: glycosyltransferase family 2 protein [Pseudomonadota bacterium]
MPVASFLGGGSDVKSISLSCAWAVVRAVPLKLVSGAGGLDRLDSPRIGDLLTRNGRLSRAELEKALEAQADTGQPLGRILVARELVDQEDVSEALAAQWGLGTADLDALAPDPALAKAEDLETYLHYGLLPYQQIGTLTSYVIGDPELAQPALASLRESPPIALVLLAPRPAIDAAVRRAFAPALARRAATMSPPSTSVRTLDRARMAMGAVLAAIVFTLLFGGTFPVVLGLITLFCITSATTLLRLCALFASHRAPVEQLLPEGAIALSGKRRPPVVSLMIPLYREANMIPRLIKALEALDYPRELLDVMLLVEADDKATLNALAITEMPPWLRAITVPPGAPRTKPKAMNHALDYVRGEVVGILDAEDVPDPQQIAEVVGILRDAPPEVACVQCQLGYYNVEENWMSRCFTLEYAIWFDVLLRGFQWLHLPIPLGGTSVYFRRSALKAIGGWDAHNVTEDADLGMRLARAGKRCAVSRSLTREEANCRAWPWIRQRSRWLKGYILTWLCHMRDPVALWRDLGTFGFFGFNVLFLGAAVAYLTAPLFWITMLNWVLGGETILTTSIPGWAIWPVLGMLALGQGVMLSAAILAVERRQLTGLLIYVPTLLAYWTLGAVAAWKAVYELIVAPYFWDKTNHGVSRIKPPA